MDNPVRDLADVGKNIKQLQTLVADLEPEETADIEKYRKEAQLLIKRHGFKGAMGVILSLDDALENVVAEYIERIKRALKELRGE